MSTSHPDILEVENVFGISSSRLGSGFLSNAASRSPNLNSSSPHSGLYQQTSINLQLGPCLTSWITFNSLDCIPQTIEQSPKKSLERCSLVRLHKDAITHLLPLTSTYSPLPKVTDAHYIVSASYHADISIWDSSGHELLSWNVYDSSYASMDLPVNWMAYNPTSHHLAVISGPKNPSMPPPPATDRISPVLPQNSRITVYDLSSLMSSPSTHNSSSREPSIVTSSEFFPNGEVILAFCAPSTVLTGMLAACLVDVKRQHGIVLFHKDNLNYDQAAILRVSGGSITYFSATPDGRALVLLRGKELSVYRPVWDESTQKPSIEVVLETKLHESDCSPFHWLDTSESGIETVQTSTEIGGSVDFLTASVKGQILHYRLSNNFTTLESIRNIPSTFSGSLYHLIWNDQHHSSDEIGELIRIGMFGLETEQLPLKHKVPVDESINKTENSLHQLTCCGIAFNQSGNLLAIGDWSGTISIWDVSQPNGFVSSSESNYDSANEQSSKSIKTKFSPTSSTSKPYMTIKANHSMVRALEWHRHPYNDGRTTIMIGDTSGRLLECTLSDTDDTIPYQLKTVSNTKRTITCMAWSPPTANNLFLKNPIYGQWKCFLATGDSSGKLRIYGRSMENDELQLLVTLQAHIQMAHVTSKDIWTLAFSPCGRYIATGSEDYTVHVYRFSVDNPSEMQQIATLEGPDAAVTCIDWQVTPLGSVLIVASDDRTIHCWNFSEEAFTLMKVIRTNWEDLMITYTCLETNGTRITCATMYGYVYVFHLDDDYRLRCKLHLGSIEGMAWNRAKPHLSQIAVCSSDCSSTLMRVPRALDKQ